MTQDNNLFNVRFADAIFLISGTLKQTTTRPDELITATTAHGLQLHAMKTKSSPTRRQKTENKNNNKVAV